MTTWPAPITAITLFVEDVPAMRSFYSEVFGLPVHYEDEASVVFDLHGTLINLLDAADAVELIAPAGVGGADAAPRVQLTVTVDDVDAASALVTQRGAVLLNGPVDRPWGIRTSSFRDPAGHIWEIASA